jgi:hypothetical protein
MTKATITIELSQAEYEAILVSRAVEEAEQEQTELKEELSKLKARRSIDIAMIDMAKALNTLVRYCASNAEEDIASSRVENLLKLRHNPEKVSWEIYNNNQRLKWTDDRIDHINRQLN